MEIISKIIMIAVENSFYQSVCVCVFLFEEKKNKKIKTERV